MINYDQYNREERAICAHLFRLLHERVNDKTESPLGHFLDLLSKSSVVFKNGDFIAKNLEFNNIAIFSEASIIRDAFQNRKPEVNSFMDSLTRHIMTQENVNDCRLYSHLPEPLSNCKYTHPKQIRQKSIAKGIQLNENEIKVYSAMQSMFNAKPDLVITIDNILFVCEVKFTESFDEEQLKRTWKIAGVCATLLYEDLGFSEPPIYCVFKLGCAIFKPHINWTEVNNIAEKTFYNNDRSRIAIKTGLELLKHLKLE